MTVGSNFTQNKQIVTIFCYKNVTTVCPDRNPHSGQGDHTKPWRKDPCMTKNPIPFTQALSKTNRAIVIAYQKGYRVIDGVPYSPTGKRLKTNFQNQKKYRRLRFSVKVDREKQNAYIHKLVAFQKFGFLMFADGIQVRHLDGDSMNNQEENIEIGQLRIT